MTTFILFALFVIPTALTFCAMYNTLDKVFSSSASNGKVAEFIALLILFNVLLMGMGGNVVGIIASAVLMYVANADKWQALKDTYNARNGSAIVKGISVVLMATMNMINAVSEFTSSNFAKAV